MDSKSLKTIINMTLFVICISTLLVSALTSREKRDMDDEVDNLLDMFKRQDKPSAKKGYGETCTGSEDAAESCDETKNLVCKGSPLKCDCTNGHEHIPPYSSVERGEECLLWTSVGNAELKGRCQSRPEASRESCGRNAICKDNVCECRTNFEANGNIDCKEKDNSEIHEGVLSIQRRQHGPIAGIHHALKTTRRPPRPRPTERCCRGNSRACRRCRLANRRRNRRRN